MTGTVEMGNMMIAADALPLFKEAGLTTFDDFMNFAGGTRICRKRGRSVVRLEIGGRAFYLKRNHLHRVEFWKALSRFRWPTLGARTEWENILAVQQAGIPTVTPVAMGERSRFGIETASFTLTEELYGAEPLEEVIRREFRGRLKEQAHKRKRLLILEAAAMARKFHGSGLFHQDFYLGHFFLDGEGSLYLIDLQRVGCRKRVPQSSLIKDLGQLEYSARTTGCLSRTDRMRFYHVYCGVEKLDREKKDFLERIMAKADRIAAHTVKLLARRRLRGEIT